MTSIRSIADQVPSSSSSKSASIGFVDHAPVNIPVGNRSFAAGGQNCQVSMNAEFREASSRMHRSTVSSVLSVPFGFPNDGGTSQNFSSQYHHPQTTMEVSPYPYSSPARSHHLSNARVHARTGDNTKNLPHKASHHNAKHHVIPTYATTTTGRSPVVSSLQQQMIDSASLTAASSLRTLARFSSSPNAPGFSAPTSADTASEADKADILIKKRQARKCKIENCINTVVQGGLCISHGAKRKLCGHPGCSKKVKKAGMCSAHGPARKRCDNGNCSNIAVQGGLCISHGAKKRMCSVTGCSKKARAVFNQMCKRHHDDFHHRTSFYATKQQLSSTISPGSSLGDASDHSGTGMLLQEKQLCYPVGGSEER